MHLFGEVLLYTPHRYPHLPGVEGVCHLWCVMHHLQAGCTSPPRELCRTVQCRGPRCAAPETTYSERHTHSEGLLRGWATLLANFLLSSSLTSRFMSFPNLRGSTRMMYSNSASTNIFSSPLAVASCTSQAGTRTGTNRTWAQRLRMRGRSRGYTPPNLRSKPQLCTVC